MVVGGTFSLYTTGLRGSLGGKDGRLSPEPVLGDSGSRHLRTPIILTVRECCGFGQCNRVMREPFCC